MIFRLEDSGFSDMSGKNRIMTRMALRAIYKSKTRKKYFACSQPAKKTKWSLLRTTSFEPMKTLKAVLFYFGNHRFEGFGVVEC